MSDDPPPRWLGALAVAGRATASAAQLAGRAVADQWRAIDPDVRQQVSVEGAEGVELEGFRHSAFLLRPRAWQRVFATLEAAP